VRLDLPPLARLRPELVPGKLTFRTPSSAATQQAGASLTVLGILFGVASVIAMLAIGKGASARFSSSCACSAQPPADHPLVQQKEADRGAVGEGSKEFSPGLTYADAEAIARVIPAVDGRLRRDRPEHDDHRAEGVIASQARSCVSDVLTTSLPSGSYALQVIACSGDLGRRTDAGITARSPPRRRRFGSPVRISSLLLRPSSIAFLCCTSGYQQVVGAEQAQLSKSRARRPCPMASMPMTEATPTGCPARSRSTSFVVLQRLDGRAEGKFACGPSSPQPRQGAASSHSVNLVGRCFPVSRGAVATLAPAPAAARV